MAEEEEGYIDKDLSDIIRLSVSSYGETEDDLKARKQKLLEVGLSEKLIDDTLQFEAWLGGKDFAIFSRKLSAVTKAGHDFFGYDVLSMEGKSDYFLASDELIEPSPGCCGCCMGVRPSLDEMSLMLTSKRTGSSLIHVHTVDTAGGSSKNDLSPTSTKCVKIIINAETKGIIRLDFPPCPDGTQGDYSMEMIPVAVIGQDNELVFIFKPSALAKDGDVTEIITADGTGFCVAKVGPVESVLNETIDRPTKTLTGKDKHRKDHFCILFLDDLLGRSWKQLLFSVSTVFFYLWIINKAYRNQEKKPNENDKERTQWPNVLNCTIS